MTITKSGELASFYTVNKAPIKHLRVYFSPKQAGEGDPSPENVREISGWNGCNVSITGKNLIKNTGYSGQFFNVPTNTNLKKVSSHISVIENENNISVTTDSAWYNCIFATDLLLPGNYNIHYESNYNQDTNLAISSYITDANLITKSRNSIVSNNTTIVLTECARIVVTVGTRSVIGTISITNLQVEMSNNYTNWKKYTGSNHSIIFPTTGKNLFNINRTEGTPNPIDLSNITSPRIMSCMYYYVGIQSSNYYYKQYTQATVLNNIINVINKNNNSYGVGFPIQIKSNTKYTLSFTAQSSLISFGYYDNEWHYLSGSSSYSNTNSITITTPNNAYYIVIVFRAPQDETATYTYSNIQFEEGETATSYEPYIYIYGGYIDLITGELVQTYTNQTYDGSSDESWALSGTNTYVLKQSDVKNDERNIRPLCDKFLMEQTYTATYTVRPINNNLYANSVSEWCTWLSENPIQVVYQLTTPITHQLTTTQLSTLIGQNNIWSNADRVEVEYDLAESNDELYRRRNIILQGAPHLVTSTGSIANFNTDLAAPLKECKVSFSPIQEGSGDPSPDNVRDIGGWTGCNIYQHGRNLIDKNSLIVGLWWKEIRYGSTYYPNHYRTPLIPVKPGASYYLSRNSGNQDYLSYFDKNQTYVQQVVWSSSTPATKQIPDNIYYVGINIKISEVDSAIFQLAEQDINYTTFISNITVPIDWTSNGTIYGGYVDLINGELIQTYKTRILNGSENDWGIYQHPTYGNTFYIVQSDKKIEELTSISDLYTNIRLCYGSSGKDKYAIFCDHEKLNRWYFRAPNNNITTISEWQNWLSENNITITYKLASPIHHSLTLQTLKTLRGVNNIWSNANGPISIKYWTH